MVRLHLYAAFFVLSVSFLSAARGQTGVRLTDDIIVDDEQATALGAAWSQFASGTAFAGNQRQRGASAPSNPLTFTATLPTDGYYNVLTWIPGAVSPATAATAAPFRVYYYDLAKSVLADVAVSVDQTQGVGTWVSLGMFPFQAATPARVVLDRAPSGAVVADAVRFVEVTPDVLVKNNSSGSVNYNNSSGSVAAVAKVGAWTTTTILQANGGSALVAPNTTNGTRSVKFTPDLPTAGEYDVFIYWPERGTNVRQVQVRTIHAGSSSASDADVQNVTVQGAVPIARKGSWRYVATYRFPQTVSAMLPGSVAITSDGLNVDDLVADAVRFAKVGTPHILDNSDPAPPVGTSRPGVTMSAIWPVSTVFPYFIGVDYAQIPPSGGNKDLTYFPQFRFPSGRSSVANYDVFMWWPGDASNATNTQITVQTSGGVLQTASVNQTTGNKWTWLGRWLLDPATASLKIAKTASPNTRVVTDAVNFLRDPDSDRDALDDDWEWLYAANLGTFSSGDSDADSDGRTDSQEFSQKTDPLNPAPQLNLLAPLGGILQ